MLEEKKILKNVTIHPAEIVIVVAWGNQVLKDGVVIAETEHRSSYGRGEMVRFLTEVEGAAAYAGLINWAAPFPDPLAK